MMGMGRRFLTAMAASAMVLVALLFASPVWADYEPDPNAPRSEVPADYQWKTEHIFPSVEAWQTKLKEVEAAIPHLGSYQGRLGESAATLLACLQEREQMGEQLTRLYSYANLNFDVDQSISENQARLGQVRALFPKFGSTVAYIEPELLQVDPAVIEGFMAENEDLRVYEFAYQELLRQKKYTLSPKEEQILARTGNISSTPSRAHSSLMNVDLDFPDIIDPNGKPVKLTMSGFTKYRAVPVYNVRKQAADAFFGTLRSYENTFATLLDGVVNAHILDKDARGYDSCLEAALYPQHISTDVYLTLIKTINENLPRTLHKYITLRRKVLGLDGPVTFPNLYNPMIEDYEAAYTYDEGRALILAGLKPMGEEYLAKLTKGMDPASGWIDIYPNANKESGAYSNGAMARKLHPYIKHNFDNTLDAVFTTAHEFGHALHSDYSRKSQPPVYGDYTTFLAEIASTINEALLTNYMLRNSKSDEETLYLLNQRLESIRLTIFRQTLFAEFELKAHEHVEQGNSLTPEFLNGLYADLIQTYYGSDFEMGENDPCEWMFIPHFYYDFYVYSYATGLTSGISLAQQIDKNGQKTAQKYLDNMLKAGSSAPPLDILRNAGVNLETPQPFIDMLNLFEQTVDQFDRIWTKNFGS
jgi:oligoendopeptidase F